MDYAKGKEQPKNPREGTNCLSFMCFCYVLPTFCKGRKRDLESTDLYRALKEHKSSTLGTWLYDAWLKQLARHRETGKEPSLLRALISVFGVRIMLLGLVLFAIEIFIRVPQPIYLGGLIYYYGAEGAGPDINRAYLYGAAVFVSSALNVFLMHPYVLAQLHCGMKLRVAICSMIYRKSLKLSKNALGETTAGQVVNLLSNDVSRFDLSIMFIHYLWVGPVETFIILYLMYQEIQISAFCGVIFLLAFIPLQGWLGKKTSSLRLKTAKRTDERVRLMNEIIQGIQVIKMYAWEKPFGSMITEARRKEIKVIKYVSYVRGILLSFIMFTTRVSIFFSLVVYALLGNLVTAEKAFVITAYYNILRQTMTVFFPQGIGQFAESLVSVRRIQAFLLYDEKEKIPLKEYMAAAGAPLDDNHAPNGNVDVKPEKGGGDNELALSEHLSTAGVQVTNIRGKWNSNSTEYTLDEVNLRVQPQTLVALIGPVGSGKSSLIQAILRELPIESGSISVNGDISYASQEPWLFSGTVRTNILFGQPMDRDRYKQVVKKCALERDFALFPHGDKTIVGERGTSLSGGQKARISLARACYRDAAIYLLDDPLSAVDTHVGKHLFDQCLRSLLKRKIVILATHQLQYLQHVDQIVIFNHGRVEAVGTYDSLRETGLDFAKLLADPSKEEKSNDSTLSQSRSSIRLHRQNSEASSQISLDVEDDPKPEQEKQQTGAMGWAVYKLYYQSGGGFFMFLVMVIFFVIAQVLASGGDYFVLYWVNKEEMTANNETSSEIFQQIQDMFKGNMPTDDRLIDIIIFSAIILATVIMTLGRSFWFFNLALRASTRLHNRMYEGVTRATMNFFHTNPSGRILNRFSKDMGQLDEILPATMIDVVQIFLSLVGIIIVVAVVNYYLLIPTIVIGVIFYFLREFYLKTSRSLKRIEAISRSPIYSHLGASLTGLATIRAFGAEEILIQEFDHLQDLNSSAFYMFIATSRAFGSWLDIFCVIFIGIVCISSFMTGSDGANIGLSITQAMGMTGMVQWGMRQSAELENNMNAVERVAEYEKADPEAEFNAEGDKKPPADWPAKGGVKFDKVSLRYFPDPESDLVLKELEFDVKPREKIGIVGRTGAGKSSLINALFRLSYNEGSIVIDGRDIHTMGLHDLRKRISIIPQEPVLFSGTMRYNLDPFDEYTDEKVWSALAEVKLKEEIVDLPHGLQSRITEGGGNFSVGQRQLVCLARAILRENRVLVMDEATANVDPQTDKLIQATIRTKFADCTIFTIAHRLNTVMDSDKVLVMDAGRVIEFGSPYELLTDTDGPRMFYGMVEEMGRSTFAALLEVAKEAHESRTSK